MTDITSVYRNMEFCSEVSPDDFFTHKSVKDLINTCESNKEKVTKVRTIGVLESINGKFFMKDLLDENSPKIRVSFAYTKSKLQTFVTPTAVQIFGTLQFKSKSILFAKIVQVLNTITALRLSEVTTQICSNHLAILSQES